MFEKRFRRDGDTEGRGELHRAPCVLRQVRVDLLRQEPIEVLQGHQRIDRRMMGLLKELEEQGMAAAASDERPYGRSKLGSGSEFGDIDGRELGEFEFADESS